MVLKERLTAFLNEKQNMLLNFIMYESQNTIERICFYGYTVTARYIHCIYRVRNPRFAFWYGMAGDLY